MSYGGVRRGRWGGRTAATVVLSLLAGLCGPMLAHDPVAEAADRPGAAAGASPVPVQRTGSAADLPHEVGAEATEARGEDAAEPAGAQGPPPEAPAAGTPARSPRLSGAPQHASPAEVTPVTGAPARPAASGGAPGGSAGGPGAPDPGGRATGSGHLRDDDPSVEVVAERTADTRTFHNADGSTSRQLFAHPVNYRTTAGDWAAIDTTLVPASDGGLTERANGTRIGLARRADAADLETVALDAGHGVRYALAGAAPVAPEVSGDTATYRSVLPGTDLRLTALWNGVKEEFVLAGPAAAGSWTFPLHTTGLTPALTADGEVEFKDGEGTVRMWVPRGLMHDSAPGGPAESDAVHYTLAGRGPDYTLTVTADPAWLHDPARVFPVVVDPTTTTGTSRANASTYVDDYSGANHAGTSLVLVGGDDSHHQYESYLSFGSVQNYTNDYVVGAALHLYQVRSTGSAPVTVAPITGAWSPTGVNRTGAVPTGGVFGQYTMGTGQGWAWIGIDGPGVSVIDGCTHGQSVSNCGIAVRGSAGVYREFASATSANAPYLQLEYTPYAAYYSTPAGAVLDPAVTNGQAGALSVEVLNHGAETWPANGNYRLSYRLYQPGTLTEIGTPDRALTPMPVDVPPNQKVTLNAGVGPLPPGSYVVCWDMRTPAGGWFSDSSGIAPGGCFSLTVTNVDPVVDAVAPPRGFAPDTLTPVLTVAARDLDHWPSPLRYQLVIGNHRSDWQSSGTFTVPAGVLRWGRPTEWWVDVTDGLSTVSSPSGAVAPQVPQPVVTSHLGAGADPDLHGIDPLSGNWSTSATDASVPTAGPPLAVKRSYNSLDTRAGGLFGTGWSSPYDGRLTFENNAVLVTLPDGQQVRFLRGADGGYTGPAGRYATLAAVTGGTFELTDKSGTVLAFDANGRLTRVTDAAGFAVTHQYRADGTLETVTSAASGRALHLGWTRPAGSVAAHVTSVSTDPVTPGDAASALTWTYRYTGDNLTAVCAPGAGTQCTGYQYTATSHYRSQVADAAPTSYLRLGDPVDPRNETEPAVDEVVRAVCCATARYAGIVGGTTGALSGSTDGAALFNGYGTKVTAGAAAPGASNQGSTELWFRTAPGSAGILYSYQNKAIGAVRTGPPESPDVPALYVGTDGRLYGGYYDTTRTAMPSGRYVTDNAWHHVVLTASGQSQELWLDGQRVATRAAAVVPLPASDRAYLGAGYGAAGYPVLPGLGRDTFFAGAIDEFADYGYALTAERITAHFAARSPVSTLSAITLPSGRSWTTVGYDSARDRVADVTDANGGHWKPSAVTAVLPAGVAQQQAVLATRPDDYYRMDEGAGQVAHSAVRGREDARDGTFTDVTLGLPHPASPTGGDYGIPTVAGFGTGSALRLPDGQIPAEGDFSVEIGFRTDRPGVLYSTQDRAITAATPAGAGSAQPLLYIGSDGRLRGGITNGPTGLLHGPAVNDNVWHTAVLTWKQQTATGSLYLDGRLQESGSPSGLPNRMAQRYTYAGAGFVDNSWAAAPADRQGHLQGQLADLAVWSRALTAAEVRDTHPGDSGSTGVQLRVTVTDPGGKALLRTFDPAAGGRVTSATDAGGGRTGYGYDEQGYPNRTTDAAGHTTALTNDARGNVLSRTTCRTPTWCQTSYTEYWVDPAHPQSPLNDRPTVFRDARSSGPTDSTYRTAYQYDAVGNLLHTVTPPTPDFPQGRDTAQEYSTQPVLAYGGGFVRAGMLTSATTPGGAVTRYTYYRNTDLAQVVDPAGATTTYTYDGLGRRLTSTRSWPGGPPGGLTTGFTHDGQNRPRVTTMPWTANDLDGTVHYPVHEVEYDADGNITVSTERDGNGGEVADPSRTTVTTYDTAGRVSTVTDPGGRRTVTNSYDVHGQPTSVTDPAGRTWLTAYTATGLTATTTLKGYTGSDPEQPRPPTDLVVSSRAYDPAGRPATVTDAMGRTTRYQYYDDNRLARVSATGFHNPDGSTRDVELRRLDYDAAGQLTRTLAGGGANSNGVTYDAAGRVTSVTVKGSPDQVTRARYDADGNPVKVTRTDAAGTVLAVADAGYDAAGRIISQTLHTGTEDLISTWTRDARGLVTAATDPRGTAPGADPAAWTTEYGYDRAGRPAVVTGPAVTTEDGSGTAATTTRPTTRTAYNTYGEPVLGQDALGTLTQSDYDQLGRQVSRGVTGYRPPGGGTALTAWSNVSYDAAGRIATSQDASRQTTTFGYDQLDHLLTRTDPKADAAAPAGVWRTAYDAVGEQLSATDPTGARTTATYDDLGRPVTGTVVVRSQAAAYTTTTGWDDAGNAVTVTDPLGNTVTTAYDAANRPVTVTDPLGRTVTTAYDAAGRPVKVTAADGSARTTAYDGADRTTGGAELDPAGRVLRTTSTGYDRAGNPVRVTDPLGTTTTRAFDAAGRTVSLTEPVTAATANTPATSITSTYGYDAAGNRTRFTDGRGNTFRSTYNAWGLPESEIEPATDAYPAAADRTRTSTYDAAGRIVRLAEPGGVVRTRTYDALGRLTAETGAGAEAATAAHSYGYDPVGRVTRVAGVGGDNTYVYDDRGLLTSAQGPSGTASFGYDANGQLTTRLDAAGTTSLRYDAAHRLVTLTDPATAVTATYGYNTLDQVERIGYGVGGAVRTFGHDALHRLSSDTLTAPGGAVEAAVAYGYDLTDHLTAKTTTGTAGAAANTYGYDLAGRLTSWNNGTTTTEYGYDAAGNRTRAGPASAVYDARNRLLSDATTGYTWTARGTQKTRSTTAGTVTSGYDAFDRLVTDGTGTNAYDGLDRLVRTGSRSLSYTDQGNAVASDGTTSYSHDAAGAVFGWQQNGTGRTLALVDRHTDVVGGFTATGTALTGSTAYDPFGQVTATAGSQPSLGYQSSWTDPDSGRANMAARWYDPSTGAFTSRDTYSQSPDPSVLGNRYAYAGQDPLDHTDPSGHCAFLCSIVAGAVAGAVVGFASYAISYATTDNAQWSWKEAGWQAGKGAVTGAVMGMGGTGAAGLILGGAAGGGVDYGMECLRGSECTVSGAAGSIVVGGVAGALTWGAGKVAQKIYGAVVAKSTRPAVQAVDRALTRWGVVGARDAANVAAERAATKAAATRAASKAATEAAEREVVRKAQAEAAARAKKAAEEEARQRWLATPTGRAFQAAADEGPDVVVARTRQAVDQAVPAAALAAHETPSLAQNLVQGAGSVVDNSTMARDLARAAVGRSGSIIADVADVGGGRTVGGLGGSGRPSVASYGAGDDAAEIAAFEAELAAEAAAKAGRPTMARFADPSDDLYKFAANVPREPGYFDVFMHGGPFSVAPTFAGAEAGGEVDAQGLAALMREAGYVNGPVRLCSCQTGATTGTFAQDLANALGVPVKAPTGYLYVYETGRMTVGRQGAKIRRDTRGGRWRTVFPQK